MKILVIPDVHLKPWMFQRASELMRDIKPDRPVCLMDIADDWRQQFNLDPYIQTYLSGGVKTLILTLFKPDKIFNASTCGDNCAKWFLKIAEKEDRTINLRHIMDFGEGSFEILVLNSDIIVHSQKELVEEALDFL